ncbi:hypothetical protein MTR_1g034230 [Medicago truncatula]|uniref:Retroviral polymerase SH3-like domain-containing protein n=1 Tax=Medicago truncatula TaxID=3880 RepID=A0A072VH45_MEDTR|nr:hypothetical protein MTR_1g034230 [Medicago truncatula]
MAYSRCLYKGGWVKLGQGWNEFTLENNLEEDYVLESYTSNSNQVLTLRKRNHKKPTQFNPTFCVFLTFIRHQKKHGRELSQCMVQHLRVFGSLCLRHIPDQMRRKLDDKSQSMIFVGYHLTGAYKIYDPKNKKAMFNKDHELEEQVENIEVTEEGGVNKPARNIQQPQRLNDYVRFPDTSIGDDGDGTQLTMFVKTKPVTIEQVFKQKH